MTTALAVGLVATVGAAAPTPLSIADASGANGGFALASFTATIDPTAVVSDTGTDEVSTDARSALASADAAITASAEIEDAIADADLELKLANTDIDLADLEQAVARLESGLDLPAPLVPDLSADVTRGAALISARVDQLSEALADAEEVRRKKEAAAKAAREAAAKAAAEKAAAEAAAAEQQSSSSDSGSSGAPALSLAASGTSAAEAQSIAKSMLSSYGWGGDQFSCLVSLWNKESGWNAAAYNSSSGAYGIPQALPGSKMASAGSDWQTNAATQITWGLGYIKGRYGTPCGAWSHSQSTGWY